MHFIKMTGTALVLAVGLAGAAQAGGKGVTPMDPVVVTPVLPAAPARFDWTGPYVGVQLGLSSMNVRGFSNRSNGFGGAFLGYRHDFGDVVIGAEVEANAHAGSRRSGTRTRQLSSAALYLGAGVKLTPSGRSLLSIKAGPASVSWRAGGRTRSAGGVSGGIDFDHMLSDNVMLRVGLRHTVTRKTSSRPRTSTTSGVIGIAYKF